MREGIASPPPIHFRHFTELRGQIRREHTRQQPPFPIPLHGGRSVHSRLLPQPQDILHGKDHRVGNRHHEESYQFPVNFLPWDVPSEIPEEPFLVLRCFLPLKPAPYRIVVMSPGICHTVLREVMGYVGIRGKILPKGEEEHLHARKLEVVHDFPYVRSSA